MVCGAGVVGVRAGVPIVWGRGRGLAGFGSIPSCSSCPSMFLLRVSRVSVDTAFGVGVENWVEFTWMDRMDKVKSGQASQLPSSVVSPKTRAGRCVHGARDKLVAGMGLVGR